ncbi:hypothetical protein L0668_12225 [Paraglaciecola aquimarina]|uniref:DUF2845 domain-containing protein n=1 Tax=Paraglaciecola algarum TaxID=3050085 RepID=A0ABS9DA43_9ALTE|nr:hypothetical protein [Paraglaciecola sp. G1-23]MCF2948878.1 hypothetical protein [Paraglaciecola sp. G1-23]
MKKISVLFVIFPITTLASEILWNSDKTALAFCDSKEQTVCFVIANSIATNVSRIENANLGKLRITEKEQYEKIQTFPSKWLADKPNGNLISFTTMAWKDGQRYTITGPVFVSNDGSYVEQ